MKAIKFKSWREIRDWADGKGFVHLVKRMDLNNRCWQSSGEFGRSQTQICDTIRFAETEEEQLETAKSFNEEFKENYGLWS